MYNCSPALHTWFLRPILNGLACIIFFFFFQLYIYLFIHQAEQPLVLHVCGMFISLCDAAFGLSVCVSSKSA